MGDFQFKVITWIVILLTAIVLIAIILRITPIGKEVLTKLDFNKEKEQPPEVTNAAEIDQVFPFYSVLYETYRKCKLSSDSACFCQLTYPGTAQGYVIELQRAGGTAIKLHQNAQVEYRSYLAPGNPFSSDFAENPTEPRLIPFISDKQIKVVANNNIPKDTIFIENTHFFDPSIKNNQLKINDFTQANNLYLQGKELYSSINTNGKDFIDISPGLVLYKFDNQISTLTSIDKVKGIKQCKPIQNLHEIETEFNRLITIVNNCQKTKLSEDCIYVPTIPEPHTITIEDQNINIKTENVIIKSQRLSPELCSFSNFENTLPENAQPFSSLDLKQHYQISLHFFENKLCILPYTEEQARLRVARQRAIAAFGNKPLV